MDWTSRVRAAFDGRQMPDDDVVEELTQHAAAACEAARADGCEADEAERRVQAQVTAWARDADLLKRRPRHSTSVPPPAAPASSLLAGLGSDVRYGWQLLRRQWGHSLVVVATMALGIGASTVLFSVVYGVLVKPMPWPDTDRLVRLYETRQGSTRPVRFMTNLTYLAWNEKPSTIEGLAAWSSGVMTMTGAGEPARVRVIDASPGLFPLLGATPALGRLFAVSKEGWADDSQIVLSHGLWQQRFGGSKTVIGRAVQLDGAQYTVVGVMPASFAFPDREARAWVPFNVPPVVGKDPKQRSLSMFSAVAKLRPGVTQAQAQAEANARGRAAPDPGLVVMAVFGSKGLVQVSAVPFVESITGEIRPALIVFLVAVGLLLVTATSNVASLQLARATTRRREIAIRTALGAGSARLLRQLLVENAIVGQAGGLVGLLLALALVRVLPSVLPPDFPRVADIALDWRAALFSVGLSLVAGVAFGLVPALHVTRVNVAEALVEDGLSSVGASRRSATARIRFVIMAGQIAVASVLLVGAALLARSFVALIYADRGYEPARLLTAQLTLPSPGYNGQRRAEALARLMERLNQVPGVTHAAFTTQLPLASGSDILGSFPVPARGGSGMVQAHASIRQVSTDYFAALGLPVVEGRGFTDADTRGARTVVVVNRTFAAKYLDKAVGTLLPGGLAPREVVGVVEDVKYKSITESAQPETYQSVRQLESGFESSDVSLLVRTAGDPTRLVPTLRSLVHEQDSSVALESVMTMEDRVWTSLAKPRLYALLLVVFACFALTIAGVGLFGVLSYSVMQRSREIGVRTALGATPRVIVRLVLRQALTVTLCGLALGLAASAALAKYLSKLLYGVTAYDAASYVVVPVVLTVVAVVACVIPARRAARVDPVQVLR